MSLFARALMALVLVVGGTGALFGQAADTALVVGTVHDATGAVIPGTTVTFAHLATGTEYSTQTNESGSFRSPPLRIGEYIVPVTKPISHWKRAPCAHFAI